MHPYPPMATPLVPTTHIEALYKLRPVIVQSRNVHSCVFSQPY